jgi:hypothetical protein
LELQLLLRELLALLLLLLLLLSLLLLFRLLLLLLLLLLVVLLLLAVLILLVARGSSLRLDHSAKLPSYTGLSAASLPHSCSASVTSAAVTLVPQVVTIGC